VEKIIEYKIKILSSKSINPSFDKNLDKIISKSFSSGLGKSLLNGYEYVSIKQIKI